MTIKEMIEELQRIPEDLEVKTYTNKHADQPIFHVSLEKGWGEGEDVVLIEGSF